MSKRTENRNAFESGTAGPLANGATSVALESAAGLVAPVYLVIDPDKDGTGDDTREYIRANTITNDTLENLVRGLVGGSGEGTGGVAHGTGAKVRSVPTQQIFEDIFDDIDEREQALAVHISNQQSNPDDPHANAKYLHSGSRGALDDRDADTLYVQLSGSTLDAPNHIKDTTTPSDADDLTRKGYVDDQGALFLLIDGSRAMTGELDMGTDKIVGLVAGTTAGEAVEFSQLTHDHDGVYVELTAGADQTIADGLKVGNGLELDNGSVFTVAENDITGIGLLKDDAGTTRIWFQPAGATAISSENGNSQISVGDAETTLSNPTRISQAGQNLLDPLIRNVTIDLGPPGAVDVRGALHLDAANGILYYSDGAAWQVGLDASTHTHPASEITAGNFPDTYSVLGSLGVAGAFNANTTVDFPNLPVGAGTSGLVIDGGGFVRRDS